MIIALYPHREPYFAQVDQPLLPKHERHQRKSNDIRLISEGILVLEKYNTLDKQETFSILKRSPNGARLSTMERARKSFERACLKKWCFISFSAVGRFLGSFTRQAATNSLKDWENEAFSEGLFCTFRRILIEATKQKVLAYRPLRTSCLFHNQDLEVHFVRSSTKPA